MKTFAKDYNYFVISIILFFLSIVISLSPSYGELISNKIDSNTLAFDSNTSIKFNWIGLTVVDVTNDMSKLLNIEKKGVMVDTVDSTGPAKNLPIYPFEINRNTSKISGNVILFVDDYPINNTGDFFLFLDNKTVGDTIKLTLIDIVTKKMKDINVEVMPHPKLLYEESKIFKEPLNVNFTRHERIYFGSLIEMDLPSKWKVQQIEIEKKNYGFVILTNMEKQTNMQNTIKIGIFPSTFAIFSNLTDIIKISPSLRNSLSDLSVEPYSERDIDDNYGLQFNYTYSDSEFGKVKVFNIGTMNTNLFFKLSFKSQSHNFEDYFPTISKIVNSIKIKDIKKYENFFSGIRIDIPNDWREWPLSSPINIEAFQNTSFSEENSESKVLFSPTEWHSNDTSPGLSMISYPLTNFDMSFKEIVNSRYQILKSNFPYFKDLEFKDQNLIEFVNPVDSYIYNYSSYFVDTGYLTLTEFVIVYNDRLYIFTYFADDAIFNKYFLLILDMLRSLNFVTLFNYDYNLLGITLKVPSDWNLLNVTNNLLQFKLPYDEYSYPYNETNNIFSISTKNSTDTNSESSIGESNYNYNHFYNPVIKTLNDNLIFAKSKLLYKGNDGKYIENNASKEIKYKEFQVSANFNKKTYLFNYTDTDKRFNLYFSTIKEILKTIKLFDVPELNLDLISYADTNNTVPFSILYPEKWNSSHYTSGIYKTISFDNSSYNDSPYFSISYTSKPLKLDEVIREDYEYFKSRSLKGINTEVKSISILDKTGIDFEYTFINKNNNIEFKARQIYFVSNNDLYIFSFETSKLLYYSYIPVINKMINSFKIIEPIKSLMVGLPFKEIKMGAQGISYDETTDKLYLIHDSNRLSVIDGSTNKLIKDIVINEGAYELDFNKLNNKIYALHTSTGTLTIIDVNNNYSITSIKISNKIVKNENRVGEIVVNPLTNKIYAILSDSGNITIIDGNNNNIQEKSFRKIDTKSFFDYGIALGIDVTTNRIFISSPEDDQIIVIDGNTNNIVSKLSNFGSKSMFRPIDIALDPILKRLYVTSHYNTLYIIDLMKLTLIKEINLVKELNNVNINEKDHFIYIPHPFSNSITIIDSINFKQKEIMVDNSPYNIAKNTLTNTIYVSHEGSNTIAIINGTNHNILYQTNFNIIPKDAGQLNCDYVEITMNYSLLSPKQKCKPIANPGFEFSSWSFMPYEGNFLDTNKMENNKPKLILDHFFDGINEFFKPISIKITDNTPNMPISNHGSYYVKFVQHQQIPAEFWAPFYAIIPSFFIPTIISGILSRRKEKKNNITQKIQKINFTGYMEKLDEVTDQHELDTLESNILNAFREEKINETQYNLLSNKIDKHKMKFKG